MPSNFEIAEKLSRRRARMFPLLAVLFLAGQPLSLARNIDPDALVNHVRVVAWLVWAVVLLVALAFAGGHFRGREVRAMMEDETTRANRQAGYAWGFWAAMFCSIGLYSFSLFDNLQGRESIHIILSAAIATALIRFGLLEWRGYSDA